MSNPLSEAPALLNDVVAKAEVIGKTLGPDEDWAAALIMRDAAGNTDALGLDITDETRPIIPAMFGVALSAFKAVEAVFVSTAWGLRGDADDEDIQKHMDGVRISELDSRVEVLTMTYANQKGRLYQKSGIILRSDSHPRISEWYEDFDTADGDSEMAGLFPDALRTGLAWNKK